MARISCTKLTKILHDNNVIIYDGNKDYTVDDVKRMCEAYGKDVICYIYVISNMFNELSRLLRDNNISYDVRHLNNLFRFAIKITYFKAWHWNE